MSVQTTAEDTGPPQTTQEQWRRSDQHAAARTFTFIVTTLLVVLFSGVAFVLTKQQIDAQPDVARTKNEVTTALSELKSIQTVRDTAAALTSAATKSLETFRTDATPGEGQMVVSQVAIIVNYAQSSFDATQNAVAQAQRKFDDANARAQETQQSSSVLSRYSVLYGLGAVVAMVLAALLTAYVWSERRRAWENQRLLRNAEEPLPDDDQEVEFAGLWRHNQHRLQEYHQIVVNHAQSSRQLTLVVLVAGFVVIAALGILAWQAEDVTSAVATSIAATVGAAVTAFIARTVLRNAETSTAEVNQFFRNPLEMERLLTAERLIGMMEKTKQDEARQVLISGLVEQAMPVTRLPSEASASQPDT